MLNSILGQIIFNSFLEFLGSMIGNYLSKFKYKYMYLVSFVFLYSKLNLKYLLVFICLSQEFTWINDMIYVSICSFLGSYLILGWFNKTPIDYVKNMSLFYLVGIIFECLIRDNEYKIILLFRYIAKFILQISIYYRDTIVLIISNNGKHRVIFPILIDRVLQRYGKIDTEELVNIVFPSIKILIYTLNSFIGSNYYIIGEGITILNRSIKKKVIRVFNNNHSILISKSLKIFGDFLNKEDIILCHKEYQKHFNTKEKLDYRQALINTLNSNIKRVSPLAKFIHLIVLNNFDKSFKKEISNIISKIQELEEKILGFSISKNDNIEYLDDITNIYLKYYITHTFIFKDKLDSFGKEDEEKLISYLKEIFLIIPRKWNDKIVLRSLFDYILILKKTIEYLSDPSLLVSIDNYDLRENYFSNSSI